MIKRLRFKFIAIMMAVLIVLFAALFITLNIFMHRNSEKQTHQLLKTVAEQDGFLFPPHKIRVQPVPEREAPFVPNPEILHAGRFFYVKVDHSGNFRETNFDMMFDFSKEEAIEYAKSALKREKNSGYIENLQYLIVEKNYGKIIVFAERSIEARLLTQLIYISIWVAGVTFFILFIFSLFLSKWVIQPVQTAFEKQRQFVSDASHELKTPLTIISANADVLENEIGENIRLTHMKIQIERMGLLIHNLLILAKADESKLQLSQCDFNISQLIQNTILSFESRAFEEGKHLSYTIDDEIYFFGNQESIHRLTIILIDNAIRYSYPDGEIKLTLKKENGRPYLSLFNTGMGIPEEEKIKIFDRFYRSDRSRSRETGGYGLGLAIAKSIVDTHKGKIFVTGQEGKWIQFTVLL